jgi:hypothetical protein
MRLNDTFEDADIIYCYSRHEALEDGVLVDLSSVAREVGINYPVAVTSSVYADCVSLPDVIDLTDENTRAFDLMSAVSLLATHRIEEPEIHFEFWVDDEEDTRTVPLKVVCHAGDYGEPVLTVMKTEES